MIELQTVNKFGNFAITLFKS